LERLIQPPLYKRYSTEIHPTLLNVDNVPEGTYELEEIKQHFSDTECLLARQNRPLWNEDKYLGISSGHLLMKLDKQNMTKMSFKLAASELRGDVCAAECLVNGQKMPVLTVRICK
jgi:hypothetical protein